MLEAASISMTSRDVPNAMLLHRSHVPQGLGVGWSVLRQLRERARILALDVFPVPLGPLNKYAVAMRFVLSACLRVAAIAA